MLHMILPSMPPPGSGWWTVIAAGVSSVIGLLGGNHRGKRIGRVEGEARFINAVRGAAEMAISSLEKRIEEIQLMHKECLEKHDECETRFSELEQQIKCLMEERVPVYRPDVRDEQS